MKIIDISIKINDKTIIYPGDPDINIFSYKKIPDDSSNVSKIEIGSHSGTHIDAPNHVFEKGDYIEKFPLGIFVGPCKVFDFSYLGPGEAIKTSDLQKKEIFSGDRILIKTSNSERGFDNFYDDFVYLDGDAADFLAAKKIILFGIDYLSVKKKGDKDNRAHTSLLSKNIAILESINLADVPGGIYQLISLPLNISNADGSPTRAILIQ